MIVLSFPYSILCVKPAKNSKVDLYAALHYHQKLTKCFLKKIKSSGGCSQKQRFYCTSQSFSNLQCKEGKCQNRCSHSMQSLVDQ